MTIQSDNIDMLADTFPRKRLRGVTGILDSDGQINPNPNDGLGVGFTWVRLQGERTAIAVLNVSVTTQRANVPVILEEMETGQFQIIGIDPENALFTYGAFAPALNMPDRIPEQDKSSIPHRRIKDLRLRLSTSGGLILHVESGYYQVLNGDIVWWGGGTIDLTASLPGSVGQKRIVLVGITTATNLLAQSAAAAVDNATAPTSSPYFSGADIATARNAASALTLWLWAIALFNGQTTIANTDDMVDLRAISYEEGGVYQVTATAPIASSGGNAPNISLTGIVPIANGGTGAATAVAAFNALSPLTSKGDLLANDSTNDIRLAVGASNGMVLSVDSSTATGLAWTSVGNTFSATLQTTDATPTDILAYAMALSSAVTIQARIVGAKSDYTASISARATVGFRRAAAGAPVLIGAGDLYQETDSVGVPVVTVAADAGANTGDIVVTGVALETWNWKIEYTVIRQI